MAFLQKKKIIAEKITGMEGQTRNILIYFIILTTLVSLYIVVFLHLAAREGKNFNIIGAFYWVVETMTTLGYGDFTFKGDAGRLFSSAVVISGVIMLYAMVFPLIITPWLERKIHARLPRRAPPELAGHIIIYGYSPLMATLIGELKEKNIPFIVVDENETTIQELMSREIICACPGPSSEEALRNANIDQARLLIVNRSDEENADIILTARGMRDIEIIAIVEDIGKAGYLKIAGADRVISPKTLLGNFMGRKAAAPLTDHLAGETHFFEGLSILELPVYPSSPLIGLSLREANIRRLTGANIVGIWIGGSLHLNPGADEVIKESSVLLAVGSSEQLKRLKKLAQG